MARMVARFKEGLPRVGGQDVEADGDRLFLAGTRTAVKEDQLRAAVEAGLASWIDGGLDAPETPKDPAEPLPDPEVRGKGRSALGRRWIAYATAGIAIAAAAAIAGWLLYPVIFGTDTEAPMTPSPAPVATSTVDPSGETSGTLDQTGTVIAEPGPDATSTVPPSVLEGYLRGYDPEMARAGVLLLYDAEGNFTPVIYDAETRFLVGGKAVPLEQFAKTVAAQEGQPVRNLVFKVREAAPENRGSVPASSTIDAAAVQLYLIEAAEK